MVGADIDGEGQPARRLFLPPDRKGPAGFAQHPVADGGHQAGLLGGGDEGGRGNIAAIRPLAAQERLRAGGAPGLVHLRLIEELEFAAGQRSLDVARLIEAAHELRLHHMDGPAQHGEGDDRIDPGADGAELVCDGLGEGQRDGGAGEDEEGGKAEGYDGELQARRLALVVDIAEQRHHQQEIVRDARRGGVRNVEDEAEGEGDGEKGELGEEDGRRKTPPVGQ